MRKFLVICAIALGLAACSMGNACEWALTDIQGWNLSACGKNWDSIGVCYQLFDDNQEKILGGRSAIDAAMDAFN
jgi:hypothetical protein